MFSEASKVAGCSLPWCRVGKGSGAGDRPEAPRCSREVRPARGGRTICHLTECNSGLSLHKETMRSAEVQRMRLLFVPGGWGSWGLWRPTEPGLCGGRSVWGGWWGSSLKKPWCGLLIASPGCLDTHLGLCQKIVHFHLRNVIT